MNIIIGNAWPYANGPLHIGHITALLPGDILARYYRAKGDEVFFVSGTDCHGTPVSIRAKKENKTPEEISDFFHNEFSKCFSDLGFSYDLYSKTSSPQHKKFVAIFHKKLYEGGYVYEKSTPQAFCEKCNQFLPDRFVIGNCPVCESPARGDQCESCGAVLDPVNLIQARCTLCGEPPEFKETKHLFLEITKLKDKLEAFIESHKHWRRNAYELSRRYLQELQDRSLTRDLDWGIDVPKEGYENKKIYIWAENVLGYLSDCYFLCRRKGLDFTATWNSSRQYYVHGKDNIPFHTIILPSLLLGRQDVKLKLPDDIISSEYMTLEGRKISTSENRAVWVKDLLEKYNPDSIRYFLISNYPEKRDSDFTWREFINSHNGELLGAYGNFVNRNLVFIQKYFYNKVPSAQINPEIKDSIITLYQNAGHLIESGAIKEALETIFAFIRSANKYFDTEQPWITVKNDIEKCSSTLFTCIQIIANLSQLLKPFLPFSSKKVKDMLSINDFGWKYIEVPPGTKLGAIGILFERI